MDLPFKIEKKKSFRVVGQVIQTTNQRKKGRKAIAKQWEDFKDSHMEDTLLPLMNQSPQGILGISVYNVDERDRRIFNHYIAVSSREECIDGMESYIVPERTWAIFPCTIETIGKTEGQAITKWLPKSVYRPLNSGYLTGRMKSQAPDIEYYKHDGTVEVWIAVEKK